MVLWEQGCVAIVLEEPAASLFQVSKLSLKMYVILRMVNRGQGCSSLMETAGLIWTVL